MFVRLTSGCAVSKLLQFHEGRVGELVQLQVIGRHEERWHAVHRYLHGQTNTKHASYDASIVSFILKTCTPTDTTHSVIDDFQGLWFHVKPLVSRIIQWIGLKQDAKQRGPCSCGCLPWWQEDRCRPVTGQARDFKQTELGCDSDEKRKRKEEIYCKFWEQ